MFTPSPSPYIPFLPVGWWFVASRIAPLRPPWQRKSAATRAGCQDTPDRKFASPPEDQRFCPLAKESPWPGTGSVDALFVPLPSPPASPRTCGCAASRWKTASCQTPTTCCPAGSPSGSIRRRRSARASLLLTRQGRLFGRARAWLPASAPTRHTRSPTALPASARRPADTFLRQAISQPCPTASCSLPTPPAPPGWLTSPPPTIRGPRPATNTPAPAGRS